MSWDKWGQGEGKFHLDHIKPIALFDLTDLEQQKECYHFSNLHPIWSHENISKSDWVEHEGKLVRARHLKKSNNENKKTNST